MIVYTYSGWRHICNPGGGVDVAGFEAWPVSDVTYVAETGFFLDPSQIADLSLLTLAITVNAVAPDTTPGTDEFDWWLSARTEDLSLAILTMTRAEGSPAVPLAPTYSGSVMIKVTTLGAQLYPVDTDHAMIPLLYRDVDLYVRRRSNGHIQHVLLLNAWDRNGGT